MRECATESIGSSNGVDTHIRVCETELCNDEELCNAVDCECNDSAITTTPSPDDFMCYECDITDPQCNGTNGIEISQTSCPTEKCLISGTYYYFAYKLLLNVMTTLIRSVPMQ